MAVSAADAKLKVIGGSGKNDILRGGDEAELIRGANGHDSIFGGLGDDFLSGGNGGDRLDGGGGSNTLIGGNGNDTFVIDGALEDGFQTITDFEYDLPTKKVRKAGPSDKLEFANADGKAILLVQNDDSVDIYIDGEHVAVVNGRNGPVDADVLLGKSVVKGEPASFEVGDAPSDNTAPVADAVKLRLIEDGKTLFGDLSRSVIDAEDDDLEFSVVGEQPSWFGLKGSSFYIDASDAAFDDIPDGETQVFSVTYRVEDGNGGSDENTITVGVTGAPDNTPPVIDATITENVDENTGTARGSFADNVFDPDPDRLEFSDSAIAARQIAVVEAPSGFTLYSDGSWELDTDHPDYDHLGAGETGQYAVKFSVFDGTDTSSGSATFFVAGAADEVPDQAPTFILENNFFNVSSMEPFQVDLKTLVSDPDTDIQNLVFAIAGGLLDDEITLDANGILTFYPALDEFYQDRGSDSFQFSVTDASGGSDIGTIYFQAEVIA